MSSERQDETEQAEIEELSGPPARIIYQVVRQQGDEELDRPPRSLFWSGTAAGITIMVSVLVQGALRQKLPVDTPGREVISDLGYCLGFLMVIIGRMQLFTEQTIVTVLPVMAEPGWRKLGTAGRLWLIVFAANMIGACAAAAMITLLPLTGPELLHSMLEVCSTLLPRTPTELLLQAIPAGFLLASVAWLRAGSSHSEFWIILFLTYAIVLCGFTHVVAGGAEAFLLLFAGQIGVGHAVFGIILPALIGNVIGGTGLFALLAHAQVQQEI